MLIYRCSCGANTNCPVCEPSYDPIPCKCGGVVRPPAFLAVGPADYTPLIVAMFASAIDEHDIAFLCGPWAETLCDLMGWDYGACRSYAALSKPERCTLIHTYRVVKGH